MIVSIANILKYFLGAAKHFLRLAEKPSLKALFTEIIFIFIYRNRVNYMNHSVYKNIHVVIEENYFDIAGESFSIIMHAKTN